MSVWCQCVCVPVFNVLTFTFSSSNKSSRTRVMRERNTVKPTNRVPFPTTQAILTLYGQTVKDLLLRSSIQIASMKST